MYALRLSAFLKYTEEKDMFKAYKNFCKVEGNDAMKFDEFGFWCYRMSQGNFNLEHDGILDRKKKGLVNLGLDIMQRIVENLNYEDRSRFHNATNFSVIRDALNTQSYTLKDARIGYHGGKKVHVMIDGESRKRLFGEERVNGDRWHTYTMDDLEAAFRKPNIRFEKLRIDVQNQELTTQLEGILTDLGRLLQVKCFEFLFFTEGDGESDDLDIVSFAQKQVEVMKILPYLQPGSLEKLEFYCGSPMDVTRIAETQQWRQAKRLNTNFRINVPVEKLVNFNQIDTFIRGITSGNVIALKQAFFQNRNFKFCHLHEDDERITERLEKELNNEHFNYFDGHFHVYLSPTKVIFMNKNRILID